MKNLTRFLGATFAVGSFMLMAAPVAAQKTSSPADIFAGLSFISAYSVFWICCACCIPIIIDAVLAYVVYQDAQKYKVENGVLWAIVTFFFNIIGILVYFLAIKPEALKKNSPTSDTLPVTPVA
jgi:hypothetical protein